MIDCFTKQRNTLRILESVSVPRTNLKKSRPTVKYHRYFNRKSEELSLFCRNIYGNFSAGEEEAGGGEGE